MNFNYEDFDQSENNILMADQDQENRENQELFITMPIEITEGHELYDDLITSNNFFSIVFDQNENSENIDNSGNRDIVDNEPQSERLSNFISNFISNCLYSDDDSDDDSISITSVISDTENDSLPTTSVIPEVPNSTSP